MRLHPIAILSFAALPLLLAPACSAPAGGRDEFTIRAPFDLHSGRPALNEDGTVNVVVEIPAGSCAKWEVGDDGALHWEIRDGKPRVVKYLPYPGNYGMVPRTLLAEEDGGDGDPLDVLILGEAVERGAVVPVRVIGVLELLDGGEQDDKLLAVVAGSALDVADLAELERRFHGVTSIVETWFANYKGPGVMEAQGLSGAERAGEILRTAARTYEQHHAAGGAGH